MRDGTDGQPRLLGVLGDQHADSGGVLQGTAHHQRVVHADAVVGEHLHLPDPCGHQPHFGELGPCQADGDRADRVDVDESDLLAAVPHVVGDDRGVGDRVGVGHREHRGESAECCCRRTSFDVLGILSAGLAQVGVQVDEPRQQHLSRRVDDVGRVGDAPDRADCFDLAVGDQDVDGIALTVEPHVADHDHALIASSSGADQQVEQHRHPHVYTVGNLLQHS